MATITPIRPASRGDVPPYVVRPGEAGYDEARRAWNLVADQNPAAVARPSSAAEVATVVDMARRAGLRVAPQRTGHNAVPLGDLSDAVLLRTDRMRGVAIDAGSRTARVEGGAVWDDLVPRASDLGLSALHGSAPDIGIAGYSLGGGIGWQARRHGLQANAVTAVELVTADGPVRADHDTHPDLFWALRGGGGNFGVVTALEFRLFPLASAYAGWLIFPWERSAEVLARWSEWTLGLTEDVTSIARILRLPPMEAIPAPLRGRDLIVVEATYRGGEAEGRRLLRPLRELRPEMDTFATVPPAALTRLHMDPEDPMPGLGDQALLDGFGPDAQEAFLSVGGPESGSDLLMLEARHIGGAAGRPAPGAGALSHIDAEYICFGAGIPMGPESAIALHAQLERYVAAMAPYGHGRRYLNFTEVRTDVSSFYAETAWERLQRVRREVDPDGLFRANHEIPVG
jgi:FAD/FMN-containing dehydrogenase